MHSTLQQFCDLQTDQLRGFVGRTWKLRPSTSAQIESKSFNFKSDFNRICDQKKTKNLSNQVENSNLGSPTSGESIKSPRKQLYGSSSTTRTRHCCENLKSPSDIRQKKRNDFKHLSTSLPLVSIITNNLRLHFIVIGFLLPRFLL